MTALSDKFLAPANRFFLVVIFSATVLAVVLLAVSSYDITVHLLGDLEKGGNKWRQGDWLINVHHEIVRRGLIGSGFLEMGDLLHISPLTLVVYTQIILIWCIFIQTLTILLATRSRAILLLVLTVSPVFVLTFYEHQFGGAVRKELLLYAAFSTLALTPVLKEVSVRRVFYLASGTLLCLGVLGNEGFLLFAPLFMVVGVLVYLKEHEVAGLYVAGASAVAGLVTFAIMYFFGRADPSGVCAPLLDRGLSPQMCTGAIDRLNHDYVSAPPWKTANIEEQWRELLLVIVAALMPLSGAFRGRVVIPVVAIMAVCVAPLFLFARDWGRWLAILYTCSFFLLIYVAQIYPEFFRKKSIQSALVIPVLVLNTSWVIEYCCESIEIEFTNLIEKLF